ncbi:hypothetical protein [Caldibacillus debilis]
MIELEEARLRLDELGLQQAAILLDAHLEAASLGQQLVSARYKRGSIC